MRSAGADGLWYSSETWRADRLTGFRIESSAMRKDADTEARIRGLRARVDEVDGELIRVLNERARIVQEIMAIKAETGAPIYDPKREEEILRRVVDRNEGPIFDTSMRDIFELILHRIRDMEMQRGEFSG
jgi:3-deoxy-7-phosphoheptulonate synthase/chorismate mutase